MDPGAVPGTSTKITEHQAVFLVLLLAVLLMGVKQDRQASKRERRVGRSPTVSGSKSTGANDNVASQEFAKAA